MASSRKSTSPNKPDAWIGLAERALKDFLARVSFSASPRPVAVAFSGGLDSSVLLHVLHHLSAQHSLRLFAFHIHHGLNPQADAWLAHCARIAQSYGATFAARRITVDKEAGLGIEEAARRARYAALGELCRELGIPLLLTAHHEDDQAETVLLQLLRGAGLPGLSGMPAYADAHPLLGCDVALGRPLLFVSRNELADAAARYQVPYVDDDSNQDTRYRRNAIRHRLVPVLRELFPAYGQCIGRSSRHVQQAQALLDDLADIDLVRCRCEEDPGSLDLNELRTLPEHRVDNLLRHWLCVQGKALPSEAQLQEIRVQMLHASPDSEPRYSCGTLHLRRIGPRLVLQDHIDEPPRSVLTLNWQGQASILIPEWKGRLTFETSAEQGVAADRLREGPLVLHPRTGNERLKLSPNRPSRSLKKLYQEFGIFPAERQWLPVVYLQDKLIFAAGLGMDCRACEPVSGIRLRWENL